MALALGSERNFFRPQGGGEWGESQALNCLLLACSLQKQALVVGTFQGTVMYRPQCK